VSGRADIGERRPIVPMSCCALPEAESRLTMLEEAPDGMMRSVERDQRESKEMAANDTQPLHHPQSEPPGQPYAAVARSGTPVDQALMPARATPESALTRFVRGDRGVGVEKEEGVRVTARS